MKIYTKTGDFGTTSLFGGRRVGKDNLRIESYGNVDELNSIIGVIVAETTNEYLSKKLLRIQSELMIIGTNLATPQDVTTKIPRIKNRDIIRLEKEIDEWEKKVSKLQNFILPGGSADSSKLHFARSVTRRSERVIVALSNSDYVDPKVLTYINRLSDWFFVLSRYINKLTGTVENVWFGRNKR